MTGSTGRPTEAELIIDYFRIKVAMQLAKELSANSNDLINLPIDKNIRDFLNNELNKIKNPSPSLQALCAIFNDITIARYSTKSDIDKLEDCKTSISINKNNLYQKPTALQAVGDFLQNVIAYFKFCKPIDRMERKNIVEREENTINSTISTIRK